MGYPEKVHLNIRAFHRLMKCPGSPILYLQKINYHALAPFLVSKLRRCPLVVDFDDFEYQIQRPYCWQNRIIQLVLRSADACVTGSHYLFHWLQTYNSKVFLVYTGVDTDLFTPRSNEIKHSSFPEAPTLVWSGGVFDELTLGAAHGVLHLFEKVHQIDPRVHLLIVAYGNQLSQLAAAIRENPAAEHIRLTSNLAPTEVPLCLQQAHLGILYFPEITPWVKAKSPTKLFEYMACGIVPICGRGTEADYVVSDGQDGLLFDNIQDGAARVAKLIQDRERWSEMAIQARQKTVSRYNLSIQIRQLSHLFESLR